MARHLGDREIPITYTSVLLTETVRASLHTSTPSASLNRIVAGFEMFAGSPGVNPTDAAYARDCARQLRSIAAFWRQREEDIYGGKGK